MPKEQVMCERCDDLPAKFWLTLTDAEGTVLSREAICEGCARHEAHCEPGRPEAGYPNIVQ